MTICCPHCRKRIDGRSIRAKLSDKHKRRVVAMRRDGKTYQEIANKLGMSVASAWAIGEGVR